MPRRPKTEIRREVGEEPKGKKLSRVGIKMKCRLCGKDDHNARRCPKNLEAGKKTNAHIKRAKAQKRKEVEGDQSGQHGTSSKKKKSSATQVRFCSCTYHNLPVTWNSHANLFLLQPATSVHLGSSQPAPSQAAPSQPIGNQTGGSQVGASTVGASRAGASQARASQAKMHHPAKPEEAKPGQAKVHQPAKPEQAMQAELEQAMQEEDQVEQAMQEEEQAMLQQAPEVPTISCSISFLEITIDQL